MPHLIHCSSVIFAGPDCKDYTTLYDAIEIIPRAQGVPSSSLVNHIIDQHFSSCGKPFLKMSSDVTYLTKAHFGYAYTQFSNDIILIAPEKWSTYLSVRILPGISVIDQWRLTGLRTNSFHVHN